MIRSSQDLRAFAPATPAEVTELRLGLGIDPHHPVVCFVGASTIARASWPSPI